MIYDDEQISYYFWLGYDAEKEHEIDRRLNEHYADEWEINRD